MNENNQASVPPPSPSPPPFSWWLRKLFASNPFYLASAALLLFGCYRISLDAPLLSGESNRLLFNFSSVKTGVARFHRVRCDHPGGVPATCRGGALGLSRHIGFPPPP
jgi:hypothetical protein